ncbi:MAG: hypothetical protein RRB13_11880 [bacterium]|nr:hypothetical protein [bacterium]
MSNISAAIGLAWDQENLDLVLDTTNTRFGQVNGLAAYEQALAIRGREALFKHGLLNATPAQWAERLPQLIAELEASENWIELNGLTIRYQADGKVIVAAKIRGFEGPGVAVTLNSLRA